MIEDRAVSGSRDPGPHRRSAILHRPFVVRYVVGLTLLGVVSIAGHAGLAVLEHERITALSREALAAQVEIEAQAAVSDALVARFADDSNRPAAAAKLTMVLDTLVTSEAALEKSFPDVEIRGVSAAERAAYNGPTGIDAQLERFISDGRLVARSDVAKPQRAAAASALVDQINGPLSSGLSSAAQDFKRDAASHARLSMLVDPAILITTLLIILAEAPLIFAPMSRRINREMRRLSAAEAHQRHQADHDSMTGLVNRRYLSGLVTAYEADGIDCMLMISDVDHFKTVNDSLGHDVGDQVLLAYAAVLNRTAKNRPKRQFPGRSSRAWLSADAVAGRLGGDEFLVILPLASSEEAAAVVAEVRDALSAELANQGLPAVTTSWGVARRGGPRTWSAALKAADNALYLAKELGRDRLATEHDPVTAARG